jgi:hypothetical protein
VEVQVLLENVSELQEGADGKTEKTKKGGQYRRT